MLDSAKICIATWCLVAFSSLMVIGRIYAKLAVSSHTSPNLDLAGDALVVLAWLSFLGLAITTQLFANTGFFDNIEDQEDSTSYQLELNYVILVMIWPCLYLIKFAMLCFFNRIISRSLFPQIWLAIRFVSVICMICFLFTEGTTIFWCWPVSLNWNLESDCETRTNLLVDRSTWGLHMATDLLIYCIGFSFLGELRSLPIRNKVGAGIMFALGFVGIIVSALAYWAPSNWLAVYMYRAIEQATLIIIACIPSLKFLVNQAIGQRKLMSTSSMSTVQSHTTQNKKDSGSIIYPDEMEAKYDSLVFDTIPVVGNDHD